MERHFRNQFFSLKIITEDYAVWVSVRHRCILDLEVLVPQSLPLLHLAMDIISQEATLKFNLKTRNKWHTFSTFQPKLQEKELRNKKSTSQSYKKFDGLFPLTNPKCEILFAKELSLTFPSIKFRLVLNAKGSAEKSLPISCLWVIVPLRW